MSNKCSNFISCTFLVVRVNIFIFVVLFPNKSEFSTSLLPIELWHQQQCSRTWESSVSKVTDSVLMYQCMNDWRLGYLRTLFHLLEWLRMLIINYVKRSGRGHRSCLDGLKITTKNLNHDSQQRIRDQNPGLFGYEAGTCEPRQSVGGTQTFIFSSQCIINHMSVLKQYKPSALYMTFFRLHSEFIELRKTAKIITNGE